MKLARPAIEVNIKSTFFDVLLTERAFLAVKVEAQMSSKYRRTK
jgi:hypothetical protein